MCDPVESDEHSIERIFCITGKFCVEVTPADKIAFISEELCIGCGICSHVSYKLASVQSRVTHSDQLRHSLHQYVYGSCDICVKKREGILSWYRNLV